MRRFIPIAVLLAAALVVPTLAGGQTAAPDSTPFTCDGQTAGKHYKEAKKVIDAGWHWHNWQSGPKKVQSQEVQQHINCLERRQDRDKIKDYRSEAQKELRLYAEYRGYTPFRCHGGKTGYYAIPCYIIECESHFNWFAYNPSGASWLYQLLGWGAPRPDSWPAKVENHRIAHEVSGGSRNFSPWVCA